MARTVERGEIWLLELAHPDKRRPVLVLTRSALLHSLHTATVAAITSTLRGAPTEVEVGEPEGLKHASCVNLVNLFTVPQSQLRYLVGRLDDAKMRAVCRALLRACGCD